MNAKKKGRSKRLGKSGIVHLHVFCIYFVFSWLPVFALYLAVQAKNKKKQNKSKKQNEKTNHCPSIDGALVWLPPLGCEASAPQAKRGNLNKYRSAGEIINSDQVDIYGQGFGPELLSSKQQLGRHWDG